MQYFIISIGGLKGEINKNDKASKISRWKKTKTHLTSEKCAGNEQNCMPNYSKNTRGKNIIKKRHLNHRFKGHVLKKGLKKSATRKKVSQ